MMTFNKKRTSTPQAINPLKIDPTRSITLRRSFSQWLTNVFGQLKREIVDLIVTEDAFGLKKSTVAVWNQEYEDEDWEGEIQYPNPLSLMLNRYETMDWETRSNLLSVMALNVFCPTGPGGGIDPTCSPGGLASSEAVSALEKVRKEKSDIKASLQSRQDFIKSHMAEAMKKDPKGSEDAYYSAAADAAEIQFPNKYKQEERLNVIEHNELPAALAKVHGLEDPFNGAAEPPQPKLTDKQVSKRIKEIKTEEQSKSEHSDLDRIQNTISIDSKNAEKILGAKDAKTIYEYVSQDKKPEGEINSALERAIAKAAPSVQDHVIYRGMRVDNTYVSKIEKALENGQEAIAPLQHASSFAGNAETAYDFAKAKGHRAKMGDTAIVMEVLAPKGTKMPRQNLILINEVFISGSKQVRVVAVRKGKNKTTIVGVLEDALQPKLTSNIAESPDIKGHRGGERFVTDEEQMHTIWFAPRYKAEDTPTSTETINSFCATGPGGGVDPTCSPGEAHPTPSLSALRDVNSPEHKFFKQKVEEAHVAAKCKVGQGAGKCDQVSVSLWDNLGRPKDLVPYSVKAAEEEHVVLHDPKTGLVIDPTGYQFGHRVFNDKKSTQYTSWQKLTAADIEDARTLVHGPSHSMKEAALKAVDKAPTVHANELTPGAARPGVLARGNLMANPLPTDISEKTAKKVKEVMNDSGTVRTTKEVEIGSLVSLQSVVNKDSVKHFIKTDDRKEQSHELPVVVRVGKKLYLYDGNHRTAGDLLAGRKTTRAVVYEKAKKPTHNSFSEDLTLNTRWKYKSQSEAAEQFDQWLKGRLAIGPLSQAQKEKWKAFIQKGFEKGASRAFDDTTAARKKSALDSLRGVGFVEGRREQFIRQSISTATAAEKLRLLEQRALSELKGMTEEIRTKAKRAIMDGLVRGDKPKDIAAKLQTVLDISKGRAETIAYTELVRAHAGGQLEAMEQLGVTEVGVAVEWTPREGACPLCTPMKGVVLSIQEAKGMIPRHPRCMCAFVPANIGEDKTEKRAQKRGKYKITKAITQSQKREFKSTGEVSDWGPNKPITKKRPESTVFNQAVYKFEELLGVPK